VNELNWKKIPKRNKRKEENKNLFEASSRKEHHHLWVESEFRVKQKRKKRKKRSTG
jgi:hypothetical protein